MKNKQSDFLNVPKTLKSHVWLFVTPWTVAQQALLSMGFPGKNTGEGCHALDQVTFPTK